jgi:hypothetical protein
MKDINRTERYAQPLKNGSQAPIWKFSAFPQMTFTL